MNNNSSTRLKLPVSCRFPLKIISIGPQHTIGVNHNIIAYNSQFAIKAEPQTVKITMTKNNLFENTTTSGSLPADNMAVNPMFIDAPKMNFALDKKSPCVGAGSDQKNQGSRVAGE